MVYDRNQGGRYINQRGAKRTRWQAKTRFRDRIVRRAVTRAAPTVTQRQTTVDLVTAATATEQQFTLLTAVAGSPANQTEVPAGATIKHLYLRLIDQALPVTGAWKMAIFLDPGGGIIDDYTTPIGNVDAYNLPVTTAQWICRNLIRCRASAFTVAGDVRPFVWQLKCHNITMKEDDKLILVISQPVAVAHTFNKELRVQVGSWAGYRA